MLILENLTSKIELLSNRQAANDRQIGTLGYRRASSRRRALAPCHVGNTTSDSERKCITRYTAAANKSGVEPAMRNLCTSDFGIDKKPRWSL